MKAEQTKNSTSAKLDNLIEKAVAAAQHAYIPYSKYAVGAALKAASGKVYTGCNVENASYPAGICAERTALVKAISEGERNFDTIVVTSRNGGAPCGICRQMLSEFGTDLRVVVTDMDGNVYQDTTLDAILPTSFGPASLDE